MSRYVPHNDAQRWANNALNQVGGTVIALRTDWARRLQSIPRALVLQQLIFESRSHANTDGWFFMTAEDMDEQTMVGERGYAEARKALTELGLIETTRKVAGARVMIKFVWEAMDRWLAGDAAEPAQGDSEIAFPHFRNRPKAEPEPAQGGSEPAQERFSYTRGSRERDDTPFPESLDSGGEGSDEQPTDMGAGGDDPGKGQTGNGANVRRAADAGFADWWQAYPQRLQPSGKPTRGSRTVSLDLWRRLSVANQRAAMAGLPGYVAERDGVTVDAERYLKRRLWRDYVCDGPDGDDTGQSDADTPLGRLDAEIERVRTSRDVEYVGSFGRDRRAEDLARLEAERDRLRAASDDDDAAVAA